MIRPSPDGSSTLLVTREIPSSACNRQFSRVPNDTKGTSPSRINTVASLSMLGIACITACAVPSCSA